MNISDAGLNLIRAHEGLRLDAYPDPATGGDPWTIGYGHTGPDVSPGLTITEDRAAELLRQDCAASERCIARHVQVPLTQGQFDALCSFIFNIGCEAFHNSTMLRLINDGRFEDAARQFGHWVHAAGKVMPGLVTRRAAEREVFLG